MQPISVSLSTGYKLKETFRKEFRYTGIIGYPGIAYVINANHGHHMSSSLVNSVLESWPLFVVSSLLTYLVGFAIWAAVSDVSDLTCAICRFSVMGSLYTPITWSGRLGSRRLKIQNLLFKGNYVLLPN